MPAAAEKGAVLVTGASGQVGRAVCGLVQAASANVLAIDVAADSTAQILACDLRSPEQVTRLLHCHLIRAVIHLAAVLPSAFLGNPVRGAEVNLSGSCQLLREALNHGVRRFVFASSMSVYGSVARGRTLNEDDPAVPDDPYGACKRAVEVVGEALAQKQALDFVALRIARVVGPGAKNTSSHWRSRMFEPSTTSVISVPFDSGAQLSLVHVQDVARMLLTLTEAAELRQRVYNSPAELWEVKQLQKAIQETTGIRVELTGEGRDAGPACDGSRFARDFGMQIRGLREYLTAAAEG
jgi:UDP-glucuronate 4-epimerase